MIEETTARHKEKLYLCNVEGELVRLSAVEAAARQMCGGQAVKIHLPHCDERPDGSGRPERTDDEEEMYINMCAKVVHDE